MLTTAQASITRSRWALIGMAAGMVVSPASRRSVWSALVAEKGSISGRFLWHSWRAEPIIRHQRKSKTTFRGDYDMLDYRTSLVLIAAIVILTAIFS